MREQVLAPWGPRSGDWEMEVPAPKSQPLLPSPSAQPTEEWGSQRPEPPAHLPLLPTISCQERKWGKRWVLFFGPRAWGWPASRQEKGNLERFPLRICQIMQGRRRPQGMLLPAENTLPPPPPTTELWGTTDPACQSLQVSEESQETSGRPPRTLRIA